MTKAFQNLWSKQVHYKWQHILSYFSFQQVVFLADFRPSGKGYIVLNSKKGGWQKEKRLAWPGIKKGDKFIIILKIMPKFYMISVRIAPLKIRHKKRFQIECETTKGFRFQKRDIYTENLSRLTAYSTRLNLNTELVWSWLPRSRWQVQPSGQVWGCTEVSLVYSFMVTWRMYGLT